MPMTDENPCRTIPVPRAAPPQARLRAAVLLAAGALLLMPAGDWGLPGRSPDGSAGAIATAAPVPADPAPVRVGSAHRLHRLFDRLGYDLDAVARGAAAVPALELAALPADLAALEPIDRRKALFVRAVLPIVIRANAAVMAERAGLEALLARLEAGRTLHPEERHRFGRTAERYGLADLAADPDGVRRLLRRVDAVPVSLAVAQAISESGWGTSRFAVAGNALFGQWTWDERAGIVPAARRSGSSHRVRAFETLGDSARAYLFNLNTHPAYAGFRRARAAARRDGGGLPGGDELARHLVRYSERGDAYVRDIVALIRQNRLARLDDATLAGSLRYAMAGGPAGRRADG